MERLSTGTQYLYARLTHDWGSIFNLYDGRPSLVTPRMGYKRVAKPTQSYCTGSSYTGYHDPLGFSGYGVYVYPHGVEYEGHFKDGQFDGEGTLTYPNGDKVMGVWVKGKRVKHTFKFADGMEIEKEPWDYLKYPDRMLSNENGRASVQQKFPLVEKMPMDFYFTGDGYFDPTNKVVYDFNKKSLRIASKKEEDQIEEKFPHNTGDPAVGYMPQMYEHWVAGRKDEIEELHKKLEINELDSTNASRRVDSTSVYSFIVKN